MTKYLGETRDEGAITLRTSIIGLELGRAQGLIEWFLAQRGRVDGYQRAIFSGLTTAEASRVIELVIARHPSLHGVWHVAAEPISKYELLRRVSTGLERTDIEIVASDKVACDRSLVAERFKRETGHVARSWDSMVAELVTEIRARRSTGDD